MEKKGRTRTRNPMATILAHGAARQKVVPTAKQKAARRRRPKHPGQEDDACS